MSDIKIAFNLLPMIKELTQIEESLQRFQQAFKRLEDLAEISNRKIGKGVRKINRSGTSAPKVLLLEYVKKVGIVEDLVEHIAETFFYSLVSKTPRHTNRAAGSWAMSWGAAGRETSDIGFLDAANANEVTYYRGTTWYPEAEADEHGAKILGVHDWNEITARFEDMVNKVKHDFTFKREWGQADPKTGRMLAHKTLFIYNSCPYIQQLEHGSLSRKGSPSGSIVALSLAELEAKVPLMLTGIVATGKGNTSKYTPSFSVFDINAPEKKVVKKRYSPKQPIFDEDK